MERDQQAQLMVAVSSEVEKATPIMDHYKMLGGGVDPDGIMDDDGDLMLDMDGEGLLFSDDVTFPSLPDFPFLSSPPETPSASSTNMHSEKTLLSVASSSSCSSSSASWSFFQDAEAGAAGCDSVRIQQQPGSVPSAIDEIMMLAQPSLSSTSDLNHQSFACDGGGAFSEIGLDILGAIDLLDTPADPPWEPCSIFPNEGINIDVDEGDAGKRGNFLGEGYFGEGMMDKVEAVQLQPQEEAEKKNSSEDLAKVFLDWLKSNKDMISPEDLRSIKLKRSTIECAARRLGGEKQGRMQLLKLILTWVQNNHLLGKRRRARPPPSAPLSSQYQQPFPANPSHNHYEYNCDGAAAAGVETSPNKIAAGCNSWIPYSMDPSNGAMMTAFGGGGGSDMMYPTAAAPYSYHCNTSSVMMKPQQFSSPSPDFHSTDHGVGAWPSHFAASAPSFAPFPSASLCHPSIPISQPQYPGAFPSQFPDAHQMFHQRQPPPGMASVTKEARRKRMERQRRISSLHHQRSQNQHLLPHANQPASEGDAAVVAAAGATNAANTRNWAFLTNMATLSSSHQMNPMAKVTPAPLPPSALYRQQLALMSAVPSASHPEKRRQGWKNSEKNLKFLLQKVLKQSDVGSLGRIVLPKKEAEMHLPELDARDGISIEMEDIGTSTVWNMRYRYWPNNKSRMYLLENTGDFVRSNGLQEGDFIVIYLDMKCGKYMIRGVKVHQKTETRRATTCRNAGRAQKKRSCSERTDRTSFSGKEACDDDEDEDDEDPSPSSMAKMYRSP